MQCLPCRLIVQVVLLPRSKTTTLVAAIVDSRDRRLFRCNRYLRHLCAVCGVPLSDWSSPSSKKAPPLGWSVWMNVWPRCVLIAGPFACWTDYVWGELWRARTMDATSFSRFTPAASGKKHSRLRAFIKTRLRATSVSSWQRKIDSVHITGTSSYKKAFYVT